MHRLVSLIPLLALSCAGCEWFTHPRRSDGSWYATQNGFAYSQPAVVGDTVYAATGDGDLVARNVRSGAPIWTTRIANGQIQGANLVVVAGTVIAPVLFQTSAVDAHTGQLLWTYRAPLDTVDAAGAPNNPGMVAMIHIDAADSTVFIPAWGGTVAALDARTGAVRWQWQPPPPGGGHRFGAEGVAIGGNTVYVALWHFLDTFGSVSEGRVVALDTRTGAEQWHAVLSDHGTGVWVTGRPALGSSVVAVSTLDGRVYGLDRATGALRWKAPQDPVLGSGVFNATLTSAIASNDTILVDAGTGNLRAISANTGVVLWRAPYDGQFKRDPTMAPSRIYAPDGARLFVFDRATGRLLRTIKQPGDAFNGFFAASVATDSAFAYAPVNGALWAFPH
jgi:outer membrane protein assembly factor BamB